MGQAGVFGGLEHVDGAGYVDLRAQNGVGAAKRDLERGEVDDARDAVVGHGG